MNTLIRQIAKFMVISLIACLIFSCIRESSNRLVGTTGNFSGTQSRCENLSEIRACPEDYGKIFLPRSYPARAIYIGYDFDETHQSFLETIVQLVQKLKVKPMINVLVPRYASGHDYQNLKKYFNKSFVNFIPTASDETVWTQDYFEILFDTQSGRSELVDLPYFAREGEVLPHSVSLSCQKELIHQPEYREGGTGNGDYGGNIEAVSEDIVVVGDSISDETLKYIKRLTSQKVVEFQVDWLDVGHVDELISVIPKKRNASACEQSLLVASPKRAMELVAKSSSVNSKQLVNNRTFLPESMSRYMETDGEVVWPDVRHCLVSIYGKTEICKKLFEANKIYHSLIQKSILGLQEKYNETHGCKLNLVPVPQLFVPINLSRQYGTPNDRAVAINPNSVNNIYFSQNLILAKQDIPSFQTELTKILEGFKMNIIYANASYVHELSGGIHCATNVSYACTPE